MSVAHILTTTGNHRESDKKIVRILKRIERIPEVERVILDVKVGCRHQRQMGSIEFSSIEPGGFKVKIYDKRGYRIVFVKTKYVKKVREDVKCQK